MDENESSRVEEEAEEGAGEDMTVETGEKVGC